MKKYIGTIPLTQLINNHFDFERINGYCKKCPNYGKLWSCPPFDFDVTVAFQGRTELKINAWLFETENLNDKQIEELNLATIYEMNYLVLEEEANTPGSFAFYAESCVICGKDSCSRPSNMPCRHLDKMRYPLEAFGIDVISLVKELFHIDLIWAEGNNKYPKQIVRVTGLIK